MDEMQTIAETKDTHGCTVWIVVFPQWKDEWYWTMDKLNFEGPFSSREDAERDLASR